MKLPSWFGPPLGSKENAGLISSRGAAVCQPAGGGAAAEARARSVRPAKVEERSRFLGKAEL
jgi:hypothetical protein